MDKDAEIARLKEELKVLRTLDEVDKTAKDLLNTAIEHKNVENELYSLRKRIEDVFSKHLDKRLSPIDISLDGHVVKVRQWLKEMKNDILSPPENESGQQSDQETTKKERSCETIEKVMKKLEGEGVREIKEKAPDQAPEQEYRDTAYFDADVTTGPISNPRNDRLMKVSMEHDAPGMTISQFHFDEVKEGVYRAKGTIHNIEKERPPDQALSEAKADSQQVDRVEGEGDD